MQAAEPVAPRALLLFGGGRVAQAIVYALAPLPFAVEWLTGEDDLDPEIDDPRATVMAEIDLYDRIAAAPADAAYVIVSHSHAFDYRLVHAVLLRGDFAYLGMLGSTNKRGKFERQLKGEGLEDASLARLICPMGLPGLMSREPAVIAVGLAAQLLQVGAAV